MGPPTPRTQKWVENGPITMEFDETGKKSSTYTVHGRFLGSRGRRGPFQAETGEKKIRYRRPGRGPCML